MGCGIASVGALSMLGGCTGLNLNEGQRRKPNVVVVMTNDQGCGDVGYYGNPHLMTPVI